MGRRRMIEVTIAYDEHFNSLSEFAQLLYLKILPHTDDLGRFEGNPIIIKARCMPLSNRKPEHIFNGVCEILESGLLRVYLSEERLVLQFNEEAFKRINAVLVKNNVSGKSEYPEFTTFLCVEDYKKHVLDTCLTRTIKSKEYKVRSKEYKEDTCFTKFWEAYPKKTGKGKAEQSFAKIKPNEELLNKMIIAIKQQMQSDQWQKDNGQFIPMPSTWLNQKRWEDEVRITNISKPIPSAIMQELLSKSHNAK